MNASVDQTERSGKKVVRRTRAQVFRLWIAALRSGKYKQAKRQLKSSDGFCCLGVLCDLARKDGGPQWDEHGYRPVFAGRDTDLPKDMLEYLNMQLWGQDLLMVANDEGKDFHTIADLIERDVMPEALGRMKKAAAPPTKERRSQMK